MSNLADNQADIKITPEQVRRWSPSRKSNQGRSIGRKAIRQLCSRSRVGRPHIGAFRRQEYTGDETRAFAETTPLSPALDAQRLIHASYWCFLRLPSWRLWQHVVIVPVNSSVSYSGCKGPRAPHANASRSASLVHRWAGNAGVDGWCCNVLPRHNRHAAAGDFVSSHPSPPRHNEILPVVLVSLPTSIFRRPLPLDIAILVAATRARFGRLHLVRHHRHSIPPGHGPDVYTPGEHHPAKQL